MVRLQKLRFPGASSFVVVRGAQDRGALSAWENWGHYMTINHLAIVDVTEEHKVNDRDLAYWCKAIEHQLVHDVGPAWGDPPAGVTLEKPGGNLGAECLIVALVDTDYDPDTLGSHWALGGTAGGLVDVGQALASGGTAAVLEAIGHECIEAWHNPQLDKWSEYNGLLYGEELCDPLQKITYEVTVSLLGRSTFVRVPGWVTPGWFTQDLSRRDVSMPPVLERTHAIAENGYAIAKTAGGELVFLGPSTGTSMASLITRARRPSGRMARFR